MPPDAAPKPSRKLRREPTRNTATRPGRGPGKGQDALVVLCTCPDQATAAGIATALLAAELAACVNCVAGIRSMYRWEGQIRDDVEVLLVIKTRRARYAALEAAILERHPYELPEIIALPVTAGAAGYLDWIGQATGA